jgi:hypothetical protein
MSACNQEVMGSNPIALTNEINRFAKLIENRMVKLVRGKHTVSRSDKFDGGQFRGVIPVRWGEAIQAHGVSVELRPKVGDGMKG